MNTILAIQALRGHAVPARFEILGMLILSLEIALSGLLVIWIICPRVLRYIRRALHSTDRPPTG